MTTEQHPGGVAGRYLDTTHLSPVDTIGNARWHAKKELYDAFSREARAMIEQPNQYVPLHRSDLWNSGSVYRLGFQDALNIITNRLGLNLESEDQ